MKKGGVSRGNDLFSTMSTMSNEIKLLSGNSHPILARLVADRSVSFFSSLLALPALILEESVKPGRCRV